MHRMTRRELAHFVWPSRLNDFPELRSSWLMGTSASICRTWRWDTIPPSISSTLDLLSRTNAPRVYLIARHSTHRFVKWLGSFTIICTPNLDRDRRAETYLEYASITGSVVELYNSLENSTIDDRNMIVFLKFRSGNVGFKHSFEQALCLASSRNKCWKLFSQRDRRNVRWRTLEVLKPNILSFYL